MHAPYCYLWRAPLYIFPNYLINGTARFSKKKLLKTKCVFWYSLQRLSETFLILRRTEWDMILYVYWSLCKVPLLFLSDFNETCIFFNGFSKNTQTSNIMKIRPVGAELFHADGRTDGLEEANSRLSQFCEHPLTHWGREGSFKLFKLFKSFKRPFPGFLTILTL